MFSIHREVIKHDLRFTMLGCPNAPVWSITSENDETEVLLYLTINRKEHEDEFVESIEQFVDDWATGLATPN